MRNLSLAIHRSTTLLLPTWWRVLEALKMNLRKLPRDVRTRWNSTFRMLDVALEYRAAIARMTESQVNNLRRWELTEREWEIATQLRDVLQASHLVTLWVHCLLTVFRSSFGLLSVRPCPLHASFGAPVSMTHVLLTHTQSLPCSFSTPGLPISMLSLSGARGRY